MLYLCKQFCRLECWLAYLVKQKNMNFWNWNQQLAGFTRITLFQLAISYLISSGVGMGSWWGQTPSKTNWVVKEVKAEYIVAYILPILSTKKCSIPSFQIETCDAQLIFYQFYNCYITSFTVNIGEFRQIIEHSDMCYVLSQYCLCLNHLYKYNYIYNSHINIKCFFPYLSL